MPKFLVTIRVGKKVILEVEAANKSQAAKEALSNKESIKLEDLRFTIRKVEEAK
jgi:hypothetical protein